VVIATAVSHETSRGVEMSKSVIEHVLSRLQDIGIKDVFGVAGDFAFPLDDAIAANKNCSDGSFGGMASRIGNNGDYDEQTLK
jgi:hypothetical protein